MLFLLVPSLLGLEVFFAGKKVFVTFIFFCFFVVSFLLMNTMEFEGLSNRDSQCFAIVKGFIGLFSFFHWFCVVTVNLIFRSQLVDKDPGRAISLFWAAINAGDRVESALKDMALVMKQLNRSDEAIEAIRSFRHLCPSDSQDSLDNILVELFKVKAGGSSFLCGCFLCR